MSFSSSTGVKTLCLLTSPNKVAVSGAVVYTEPTECDNKRGLTYLHSYYYHTKYIMICTEY